MSPVADRPRRPGTRRRTASHREWPFQDRVAGPGRNPAWRPLGRGCRGNTGRSVTMTRQLYESERMDRFINAIGLGE